MLQMNYIHPLLLTPQNTLTSLAENALISFQDECLQLMFHIPSLVHRFFLPAYYYSFFSSSINNMCIKYFRSLVRRFKFRQGDDSNFIISNINFILIALKLGCSFCSLCSFFAMPQWIVNSSMFDIPVCFIRDFFLTVQLFSLDYQHKLLSVQLVCASLLPCSVIVSMYSQYLPISKQN